MQHPSTQLLHPAIDQQTLEYIVIAKPDGLSLLPDHYHGDQILSITQSSFAQLLQSTAEQVLHRDAVITLSDEPL